MGFILIGNCITCNKSTGELIFDVDSNPCFCKNCSSIQTVAPVRFRFELPPCPKCHGTLSGEDALSSRSPAFCPWCHSPTLNWEEIGHALLTHEFPVPEKNHIVHGKIKMRSGNKSVPMIEIANAAYLKGRIVAGEIPPEDTIVECAVIESGQKTVSLEILRRL